MENFYIRAESHFNVSDPFIYNNTAIIQNGYLKSNNISIKLSFTPIYMKNLSFDFFLISDDQTLYKINKHRKEIENIGTITDKILQVACDYDKIAILTDQELLLFNTYFDLEKSYKFDNATAKLIFSNHFDQFKVKFGTGLITVISKNCTLIFDFDLKILSKITTEILDMVYIKKYNKFACLCASSSNIRFFEPNGLEHGEPLNCFGDSLYLLAVDQAEILLIVNSSGVIGYFMKNFFWYKKIDLKGSFYEIENNSIIMYKNNSLTKYFVYRELSNGLVINGNDLYYTNLQKALIPPPLYFKSISVDSQILSFCSNMNNIYIITSTGIYNILISTMEIIKYCKFSDFGISSVIYADLIFINEKLVIRYDKNILFLTENLDKIEEKIDFKDNLINILPVGNEIGYFYQNGQLIIKDLILQFDFDINMSFNLKYNPDLGAIFLLSNGKLQYFNILDLLINNLKVSSDLNNENISKVSLYRNDVSSFLLHNNYILYISKDTFYISSINKEILFSSYAEDNIELLTIRNESIIFYTRFGTLETISSKIFTLDIIKSLINHKNFIDAAKICDQHHINYSIFLENGVFLTENLQGFNDTQALSFFNCISFPKSNFLLKTEYLERLDSCFNYKNAIRNIPGIHNTDYLKIEHLLPLINNFCVKICHPILLKNCAFVFDNIKIDTQITKDPCFSNLNAFLAVLDLNLHFSTVINVLIALDRIDLCFYLPNLQRVVKILLTKLSPEAICKASLTTFNIEKIIETHIICQKDYATFVSFYNSSTNVKFAVYDYLENYKMALFYLIDEIYQNFPDFTLDSPEFQPIFDYVLKFNLFDQLIMYTYYNIFDFNFYELAAKYKEPLDSFYLYKMAGNINMANNIAKTHLFWKEALEICSSNENCYDFTVILIQNNKFSEAGEIVETHLKDYSSAVELYLRGRNVDKALKLYKTANFEEIQTYDNIKKRLSKEKIGELILSTSISYLKADFAMLDTLLESYNKYKERLSVVRARLNENMAGSQTTYSYSSMKSSKKALLKDRPGGLFENEYVLNKIRKIVLDINHWRILTEDLLAVFKEFEQEHPIESHNNRFEPIKTTLRKEVEEMWNYRRTDVDFELPNVEMPVLSMYFD